MESTRCTTGESAVLEGPKKILFLTYGFSIGGAETLFVNLINGIDRKRIKPIVVSLAAPAPLEKKLRPDVNVVRFPRRCSYDLRYAKNVASLILQERIDTVFALGFSSFLFVKAMERKLKPRPLVFLSVHLTKPRSLGDYLWLMIYARILTGTNKLVTTCESQRRILARLYKINEERFSPIIYNGVDTDYWGLPPASFDREAERAKFGIPEDALVIISVASFRKEKRHDIMVRAFSRLRNAGRPVYLMFVGGGIQDIQLRTRQLARRLGVAERVIFPGVVQDIRPFYWLSDLFTLASTSETFSIAALEAMSTGLPCVLTNVGGASEMLDDDLNGVVVRPGSVDAILDGWESCLERLPSRSRSKTRDHVLARFSLATCLRRYEDLLLGYTGVPSGKGICSS